MLTFSNRLYIGESINEKKIGLLKLGLMQGKGRIKLYLIALSNNEHDQLDIIHNSMLKQKLYRKLDLKIVGFCNSKEEALELVNTILQETLDANGDANMKAYLLKDFT